MTAYAGKFGPSREIGFFDSHPMSTASAVKHVERGISMWLTMNA